MQLENNSIHKQNITDIQYNEQYLDDIMGIFPSLLCKTQK